MGNLTINKRILLLITMIALLLTGITSFTSSTSSPSAFSACSAIGSSMDRDSLDSDPTAATNADVGGRKWTVEELFRGATRYTYFYGEGPETWFFAEKESRGKDFPGWSDDVQSRIEDSRSGFCWVGGFNFLPNMFVAISAGITSMTGWFINGLVGKDPFAETLVKIIGGNDTGGGLIDTFLSSFYMPLVVLTVLIMTVTIIYKGLIQMKFREALGSLIWTIGAFVIGLVLMLNPQLLAGAPQAVTSTITTCVLGAMSGQNCLTDEVTTPSVLSGTECLSTATGAEVNSSETVVNSLNCTIWKAFVLDTWAQEQFGAPYSQLYTKSPPDGGGIWENLPEGQESKYCVNLSSVASYADSVKGTPTMDGSNGTVCNVALYQLFLKTNMKDTINQSGQNYSDSGVMVSDDTGKYDSRWYNIIVPMAQDDSKWRNWSGDGKFFSRLGSSILGLIAIIAASTVLLTLAFFGGAYKVIGLILMAFAPLFFLFAIEPTKGRKIFLGWLETLLSSFLKYFAVTVMIIVSLIMYSGILNNTSGFYSLVGVIILTFALHMYRKEIIDLIGASNMGGQRLSNKANELGQKIAKQAKEKGQAIAGGAIGGALGSKNARNERVAARSETIKDLQQKINDATSEEEKEQYEQMKKKEEEAMEADTAIKALAKGTMAGSGESVKRSFKRGTGVLANTMQQQGRTSKAIERKDAEDRKDAQSKIQAIQQQFENNQNTQAPPFNADGTAVNPENAESLQSVLPPIDVEKSESEIKREMKVEELRENFRPEFEPQGDLTEEEKAELHQFADNIVEASNEQLVNLANDEGILEDDNRKTAVANEINARIQANSTIGVASNDLSRTVLANSQFVSSEELSLNVELHRENFLETGKPEELIKYLQAESELNERAGTTFDFDAVAQAMVTSQQNNPDYVRGENALREEDLKGLEDYKVKMNNNSELDTQNVTTPDVLEATKKAQSQNVEEIRNLTSSINQEKAQGTQNDTQQDIKLPDVNDIDGQKPQQPTQEPVQGQKPQQPTQEPVQGQKPQQPTQEPVQGQKPQQPTQEPVDGQKPQQPTQEPVQGPKPQQPTQEPVEGQKPKPTQEPVEGQKQKPTEKLVESQKPKQTEKPVEGQKPTQEPVEGQKPKPTQEPVEGQKQKPTEKPVEGQKPKPTEKPVEGQKPQQPTQEPVERSKPQPAEKPVEGQKPTQQSTQGPTSRNAEPTQGPAQRTVQEPAERSKPKPTQEPPTRGNSLPRFEDSPVEDKLQFETRQRPEVDTRFDSVDLPIPDVLPEFQVLPEILPIDELMNQFDEEIKNLSSEDKDEVKK